MAKKTKDLKPDIVVKNYWSNNEHFADLFNAKLFHGKQVIKADELEDMDTEESSVLEHKEYAESIQASRDNIKIRKKCTALGVELVLLGKEGQQHIHYAMPVRVMGYDYGTYKKQYENNAAKYQSAKGLSEDEYLSRMKKTDKLIPVITIVVYYGDTPWDGATSLHGMLDIPSEMAEFVNDYKMILVEAGRNELKFHNANNRDLFNLLGILLDNSTPKAELKKKAIQYTDEHSVDKSVIMTVAGAANCKLDYNALIKKGDISMCTVFEETRAEGKAEGRAEGRAEEIVRMGHEFGLAETDILSRLQSRLDISLQKAQEYLSIYGKQTV